MIQLQTGIGDRVYELDTLLQHALGHDPISTGHGLDIFYNPSDRFLPPAYKVGMKADVTLDRLLDPRDRLAALVAAEHYEFVPFFQRIEREIAALRNQNDIVARARAIVEARSTAA